MSDHRFAIAQGDQDVSDESMIVDESEIQAVMKDQPAVSPVSDNVQSGIDLLTLTISGGMFMIPIGVMSLLVVALAVERGHSSTICERWSNRSSISVRAARFDCAKTFRRLRPE
jgi:hypothetical protein